MADKKISELAAITGSATAADDYFILVDTSGAATKKISRAELNNAIEADVLSTVNIDGGTIDGTVIGGSAAAAASVTTLVATSINGVTAATAQYTSAEETKLAGIEASADVTDATNVLAGLVGQEAVATGFTGTLDGVLGGGSPSTASVTTLNTSGAVIFNDAGADVDFRVEGDADPHLIFADASVDGVVIGGSTGTQFNAVAGAAKLTVIGSSASTNVLGNTGSALQIVNTDQTALNTAGLHFSRADTDENPNFAGASIVAQFGETQTTGQYPSASLSFLTSTAHQHAPSFKMTLTAAGLLGLGTSAPSVPLHVVGAQLTTGILSLGSVGATGGTAGEVYFGGVGGSVNGFRIHNKTGNALTFANASATRMTIADGGTVNVVNTFTAGTKTFRIDHPLPAKNNTHYLLHSSIEGPQADLIYRGRADLVSGTVDVNIDTAASMTEGTFDLLCGDVQCFTSNEDGWTALKGSVTGNVLTITAQDDTCTDTVSWMVIGERKDAKMIESEWADDDGKLIVETLKSEHE